MSPTGKGDRARVLRLQNTNSQRVKRMTERPWTDTRMPVTNYCNKSMARGFYGIDRSQKRRQSDGEPKREGEGDKNEKRGQQLVG
jgi:hypothetical protein